VDFQTIPVGTDCAESYVDYCFSEAMVLQNEADFQKIAAENDHVLDADLSLTEAMNLRVEADFQAISVGIDDADLDIDSSTLKRVKLKMCILTRWLVV